MNAWCLKKGKDPFITFPNLWLLKNFPFVFHSSIFSPLIIFKKSDAAVFNCFLSWITPWKELLASANCQFCPKVQDQVLKRGPSSEESICELGCVPLFISEIINFFSPVSFCFTQLLWLLNGQLIESQVLNWLFPSSHEISTKTNTTGLKEGTGGLMRIGQDKSAQCTSRAFALQRTNYTRRLPSARPSPKQTQGVFEIPKFVHKSKFLRGLSPCWKNAIRQMRLGEESATTAKKNLITESEEGDEMTDFVWLTQGKSLLGVRFEFNLTRFLLVVSPCLSGWCGSRRSYGMEGFFGRRPPLNMRLSM